ncbi:MAG: hypothetical protein FWD61_20095, partial [Phycisphaerales bacterium]|nr:hypothetical protein [Phycisphaerales bacterium]
MSEERKLLETRIAAYIDGELPEAEAARLEVFMANTDPQLAQRVIEMMNDKSRLRALPREKAPGDLAGRIMEQVERATLLNDVEHPSVTPPRRSWWQTRMAIAAAVLVLVGSFAVLVVYSLQRQENNGWNKLPQNKLAQAPSEKKSHEAVLPLTEMVMAADAKEASKVALDFEQAGKPATLPAPATVWSPVPEGSALAAAGNGSGGMPPDEHPNEVVDMAKAKQSDEAEAVAIAKEEQVQKQLAKDQSLVHNGEAGAQDMGYVSVATAAKALSKMSFRGSVGTSDPIVVTLVARDNQDPVRLRNAIAGFMTADAMMEQHQRPVQKNLAIVGNSSRQSELRGDEGGDGSERNRVATNLYGNNSGNLANSANNAISDTFNKDGYQVYNSGRFDQMTLNRPQSQQVQVNNDSTTTITTSVPPYWVRLREDQLQQLAREFQVYTLSCGTQAFLIGDAQKNVARSSD